MDCLGASIKITNITGSCRHGHRGSWILGAAGSPDLCPFLFNAAYPYLLTLRHGGWFTWVPPEGMAIAQCANPDGAVELEIGRRMPTGTTGVARVRQVRGVCPRGYTSGDLFEFTPEKPPFCSKALGAFIPYLAIVARGGELPWKDDKGRFVLPCPDPMCDALFIIEKTG